MAQSRRRTIHEQRHGAPPGADELINIWHDDLIRNLLRCVWEAYDKLHADFLSQPPWEEDPDHLERSITQELELLIRDTMDRNLPCTVQHGSFEYETRKSSQAAPPQYDIAFVFTGDRRIMWPLEAKVVKTDADTTTNLGEYIQEIKGQYLTCRYAPFSNGGAMLCYFKTGDTTLLLNNIERRLACLLADYPPFATRFHKISEHIRVVPEGKNYPAHFRCHHMVLPLSRQ